MKGNLMKGKMKGHFRKGKKGTVHELEFIRLPRVLGSKGEWAPEVTRLPSSMGSLGSLGDWVP